MQVPQFQASRPQGVQTPVLQQPEGDSGKGNVFGHLAKLAFGAATGNVPMAVGGGLGALGIGEGVGDAATSAVSGLAGNDKKKKEEKLEGESTPAAQEQSGVPPIPPLGSQWVAQMWGLPMGPAGYPGQIYQNQPQTAPTQFPFQMAPGFWANRIAGIM